MYHHYFNDIDCVLRINIPQNTAGFFYICSAFE